MTNACARIAPLNSEPVARSNVIALALIAGIGAALAFKSRGVFDSGDALLPVAPIDDDTGQPDVGALVEDPSVYNEGFYEPWSDDMASQVITDASEADRLAAFLYMIRASEHVFPRDVVNDACYSIFYGGAVFLNASDHPVITGELKGVRLPDKMCRDAGFGPGCVSTAAGAYQIIKPTWQRVRQAGTWGPRLPDFSRESQDEAARRILIMVGALDAVQAGDFDAAIARASTQWASLPKATANQNPRTWQYAIERYNEALTGFA